ncbi:hypothetical protein ABBQ38_014995 [Trebouxia sp. C0009 RCD-2024]
MLRCVTILQAQFLPFLCGQGASAEHAALRTESRDTSAKQLQSVAVATACYTLESATSLVYTPPLHVCNRPYSLIAHAKVILYRENWCAFTWAFLTS